MKKKQQNVPLKEILLALFPIIYWQRIQKKLQLSLLNRPNLFSSQETTPNWERSWKPLNICIMVKSQAWGILSTYFNSKIILIGSNLKLLDLVSTLGLRKLFGRDTTP